MNADKKQKGLGGCDIEELEELVQNSDLDFVFDVQHAYEHDSSMKDYAQRLWDMMISSGKLVHLHASGETRENKTQVNNHSLVHESTNSEVIVDFLTRNYQAYPAPIILEGQSIGRTGNDLDAVKTIPLEERAREARTRLWTEINYLKRELE